MSTLLEDFIKHVEIDENFENEIEAKTFPNSNAILEQKEKIQRNLNSEVIILAGPYTKYNDCAKKIFTLLDSKKIAYQRDGVPFEVVKTSNEIKLLPINDDGLKSRIDRLGDCFVFQLGRAGLELREKRPSKELCATLITSAEAREILKPIDVVITGNICVPDNNDIRILEQGYNQVQSDGIFVTKAEKLADVSFDEARTKLEELLCDFQFATPADKSRALGALIMPMLRFGAFIKGNSPVIGVEADNSQTGKGYFCTLLMRLYKEKAYVVTKKNGGVGSFDESLSTGLSQGRPIILLDNIRGKIDSQLFESIITNPDKISIRIPHIREFEVSVRRVVFLATSNGMELTPDAANRFCIIRLRKQAPDYAFRDWGGGDDLITHVEKNQEYYRGCIVSIIREWARQGYPKTKEYRHDFREWVQSLDAIIKMSWPNLPAFMDGHRIAQERTANPAMSFLRQICLLVKNNKCLLQELTASKIAEMAAEHDITIPGLRDVTDETAAKKQVGTLLSQCFKKTEVLELEEFRITRGEIFTPRETGHGGCFKTKIYTFEQKK